MKEIPLTQGKVALVDDEDYNFLMRWKWYAAKSWGDKFRAERNLSAAESRNLGKGHGVARMHAQILSTAAGQMVDHINGDSLDNRRGNLRLTCKAGNGMNRGIPATNTSGFKGVCFYKWAKRTKPWYAQIGYLGKFKRIGYYSTPEEAARAYDAAALEYHGEFACLNFPLETKTK